MSNTSSPIFPSMIRSPRVELETTLIQMLNTLSPGDRLLPEPDLARQIGVSRAMLREVVTGLVERGLLIRRQGIGTFVANRRPFLDFGLEVLESLDSLASRTGIETQVSDLEIKTRIISQEEAGLFNTNDQAMTVLEVSRVIAINNLAVAFLVDIVPSVILTQAEVESSIHGSVYDLLAQKKDIPLTFSRTDIMAINADEELGKRLKVNKDRALILLTAQLFTQSEQVVDFSYSYFVPGQFQFHVMRRLGRPMES